MSRKINNKKIIFGFIVLLVIAIFAIVGSQMFNIGVVTDPVYIGEYTTMRCDVRSDNLEELSLGSINSGGEFFECNTAETGKYVPVSPGVQCEYFVKADWMHNAYDCPMTATDTDSCVRLQTTLFSGDDGGESRYVIDSGRKLYVNPTNLFSSTTLTANYPSYGLNVELATGFDFPQTLNCDRSSIDGTAFHTVDAANLVIIPPGVPVNVVTQKSLVITSQLISLDDVERGALIYVVAPGKYQLVKEADDGLLFVNLEGGVKSSSSIECMPLLLGCDRFAKKILLSEQEVIDGLGSGSGYLPVQGDTTKLCTYVVEGGKLVPTSDCIDSGEGINCPSEKPLFDYMTGECVSQAPPEPVVVSDNMLYVLLVLAAVVIGLIIVLVKKNQKPLKKSRGKK